MNPNTDPKRPREIMVNAPIRINGLGGWTDISLAGKGMVTNMAASPGVDLWLRAFRASQLEPQITILAKDYSGPKAKVEFSLNAKGPGIHDLLEKAIKFVGVPNFIDVEVTICSHVPAGCHTGTSAAVLAALISALMALNGWCPYPRKVAAAAHFVESALCKRRCGIQDQISVTYGGIRFIDMYAYPQADVAKINLGPKTTWRTLDNSLLLVCMSPQVGTRPQASDEVHREVINRLRGKKAEKFLQPLRESAWLSKQALQRGDLPQLGKIMQMNTSAQRALHPLLVSADADRVGEIAMNHNALGWHVNGAGGDGGSLTILCGPELADKQQMVLKIEAYDQRYKNIPIHLSPTGLSVVECNSASRTGRRVWTQNAKDCVAFDEADKGVEDPGSFRKHTGS